MIFEPGKSYYVLDENQYAELADLMEQFEGENFLADFIKVDGTYYATADSIDDTERQFLEDWSLSNFMQYKKSTQSSSWL